MVMKYCYQWIEVKPEGYWNKWQKDMCASSYMESQYNLYNYHSLYQKGASRVHTLLTLRPIISNIFFFT